MTPDSKDYHKARAAFISMGQVIMNVWKVSWLDLLPKDFRDTVVLLPVNDPMLSMTPLAVGDVETRTASG